MNWKRNNDMILVAKEIKLLEEIMRLDEVIASELRFEFADFQPAWTRFGHQKFLMVDQLGKQWLFKIMFKSIAKRPVAAHYINLLCGYELPETYLISLPVNSRQYEGVLVRWVDGEPLDSKKPFFGITDEEQLCIAGQLVVDWWIGNIDEKSEHILRNTKDKCLFFIDKDCAFGRLRSLRSDFIEECRAPIFDSLFKYYADFISECDSKTVFKHWQRVSDTMSRIDYLDQELLQKITKKYIVNAQAKKFLFERRKHLGKDFRSMFDNFSKDRFKISEYRNNNQVIHKQIIIDLYNALTKRQRFIKTLKKFKSVEQRHLELIAFPEGWNYINWIILGRDKTSRDRAKEALSKLWKLLDNQQDPLECLAIKKYIRQVEQFLDEGNLSVFHIISEKLQ